MSIRNQAYEFVLAIAHLAYLKAEASIDDSDDLNDETPVYGCSVTAHILARGQMIGEQVEMDG